MSREKAISRLSEHKWAVFRSMRERHTEAFAIRVWVDVNHIGHVLPDVVVEKEAIKSGETKLVPINMQSHIKVDCQGIQCPGQFGEHGIDRFECFIPWGSVVVLDHRTGDEMHRWEPSRAIPTFALLDGGKTTAN